MSKESFDKLLGFVREALIVNETKANLRGGIIVPELCLYCTIRWLAGGSYLDITDICGILVLVLPCCVEDSNSHL